VAVKKGILRKLIVVPNFVEINFQFEMKGIKMMRSKFVAAMYLFMVLGQLKTRPRGTLGEHGGGTRFKVGHQWIGPVRSIDRVSSVVVLYTTCKTWGTPTNGVLAFQIVIATLRESDGLHPHYWHE